MLEQPISCLHLVSLGIGHCSVQLLMRTCWGPPWGNETLLPPRSRAGFIKPAEIPPGMIGSIRSGVLAQCKSATAGILLLLLLMQSLLSKAACRALLGLFLRWCHCVCVSGFIGVAHQGFLEHTNASCSYWNTKAHGKPEQNWGSAGNISLKEPGMSLSARS